MCIELALLKIAFSDVSGDASILALMVVQATVVANLARHEAGCVEGHLQTSSTITRLESVMPPLLALGLCSR